MIRLKLPSSSPSGEGSFTGHGCPLVGGNLQQGDHGLEARNGPPVLWGHGAE